MVCYLTQNMETKWFVIWHKTWKQNGLFNNTWKQNGL